MTLQEYVNTHETSMASFGRRVGLAEAQLNRYVTGKSLPSITTAYLIFNRTKKKVKLQDWFKKEMEF